jgi:trehalose-6-phosphate synthase
MHIPHRLVFSLVAGIFLVSCAFAYFSTRQEAQRLEQNLGRTALVLAESLGKSAEPLVENRSYRDLQRLADRLPAREEIAGLAIYDAEGALLAMTEGLTPRVRQNPQAIGQAIAEGWPRTEILSSSIGPLHAAAMPLRSGGKITGVLAVFHEAAPVRLQIAALWRQALFGVAGQTALIALMTLFIISRGVDRPLRRITQWLRALRTGGEAEELAPRGELEPLAREVTRLASSLTAARAAAEEEARLRDSAQSTWTAERLRVFVRGRLDGRRLYVVSYREPYEHFRSGSGIDWRRPASGLVTALEPVLRACDGTWVATATGDADAGAVDENGRVRVPPDHPQYGLRRVWLSPEEERGFYLGFANEGLWPLCHIAHMRPMFRSADWECYRNVNRKFAEVVLEEIEGEENPVVLVQDYHFAMLPRMIKQRRPDARIAIFWHIPWPNPEACGICPWQAELLEGLLGADLIGFHIQTHCNNFLDTVDRTLECRIERERSVVNRRGHHTLVRPYPISVSPDSLVAEDVRTEGAHLERSALLAKHGVRASFMGVGVDRVDYTKGIPERFRAIECFLEKCPVYRRDFTFVQIGSPSRTQIPRYHDLMQEVQQEADRINRRFQTGDWRPILLLLRQHSHEEILPYYRLADLCMVTSLHDGMNLVAKEFVASRHDDQGVLILSRFTGAHYELADALAVNPYDTEEMADAIRRALDMSPEERRVRMRRMRAVVSESNVYRWAGSLIGDLCELRTAKSLRPSLVRVARTS